MTQGAVNALEAHQRRLRACRRCPDMVGPVVTGAAAASRVMLIGQAPGPREGELGRPFAWTAGKTLFGWFERIGLGEKAFRARVYMAAVCRCFPGKNPRGGDRVPAPAEISNCAGWLAAELEIIEPKLLIPVGKLAIAQLLDVPKLADVVGSSSRLRLQGRAVDVIALPHPSGASTWHRTEPGKTLLEQALRRIQAHRAWRELVAPRA